MKPSDATGGTCESNRQVFGKRRPPEYEGTSEEHDEGGGDED
jgi:hypothetical protein